MFRRAGPDDGPGIRKLLAEVFADNPKSDPEIMEWQYWKNPFGPALSWVADDDGRIVSHYGLIPVPVAVKGSLETAALGVDVATTPSHRGRGLFVQVMQLAQRDVDESKEVCVTISFIGAQSVLPKGTWVSPGQLSAGSMRFYLLPLDHRWLASRLKTSPSLMRSFGKIAFPSPNPGGARVVAGIPQGLEGLRAELPPISDGTIHDSRWWEWRYAEHPKWSYKFFEVRDGDALAGAAVSTARDTLGGTFECVLDLISRDPDTARSLIGAIVQEAGDVAGVATLALEGSPLATLARNAGMRKVPRRMETNPLHLHLSDACSKGERLSPDWSVSWCDLDHV